MVAGSATSKVGIVGIVRRTVDVIRLARMLLSRSDGVAAPPRRVLGQAWRAGGAISLRRHLYFFANHLIGYARWTERYAAETPSEREGMLRQLAALRLLPRFAVVLIARGSSAEALAISLRSLTSQLYENWCLNLALVGVESNMPVASDDGRVTVSRYDRGMPDSSIVREHCEAATEDFILFLEAGYELMPEALAAMALALAGRPRLALVYGDEDEVAIGAAPSMPRYKPAWNPELLRGQNYLGRPVAYRRAVLSDFDHSEIGTLADIEWNLNLRVGERAAPGEIHHIARVLCRRHVSHAHVSTAANGSRHVREQLRRTGEVGEVLDIGPGMVRVRYELPEPAPKVSVIVPTRNGYHLLKRCVESLLERTDYPDYELLVVDNQSDCEQTLSFLRKIANKSGARVLRYDAPFNFSAITNFAVREALGSVICLLNNDTEVISSDWLREMVAHALRKSVGAVGAMLYYPDDTVQHAGVIAGLSGVAGHWHLGYPRGAPGYMDRLAVAQDLSVVTAACMVLRRSVFEDAGGLDERNLAVAYNDVDLCLRLCEKGYRVIWTPFAELYHHESATRGKDDTPEKRGRFEKEIRYMHDRWGAWLEHDPAYNPNLTLTSSLPCLAYPPRGERRAGIPWTSRDMTS